MVPNKSKHFKIHRFENLREILQTSLIEISYHDNFYC